jgi:hypothetical protein
LDFFTPQVEMEPVPTAPPAVEALSFQVLEGFSPPAASEADEPEKQKVSKPARPLPARPPLDLAQLRKAVNLILPLFTGRDPGARDCLKDNRTTFRSAFAPEAYMEFEQSVKSGDFDAALEHIKKAARRHGITL